MSQRAIIVVDMLNDFIHENGALYCGPRAGTIIAPIVKRLMISRVKGDPVIFVQDAHDENDPEFKRFPPHCVAGTWGSQIIDALHPGKDEPVIPKKTLNPFYGTPLEKTLQNTGVTCVDVVGVCTSICVMDTVERLACRGYDIRVPRNEVADFDMEMHRFALLRMEKTYGATIL